MLWRPHFIKVKGYWRVFYRCVGEIPPPAGPRAYPADLVPFRHRRTITGPAIEFATRLNARLHSKLQP